MRLSEQQKVHVPNPERFAERHENIERHQPASTAALDLRKMPPAKPSALLNVVLVPPVGQADELENLGHATAQVISHPATLATDVWQHKDEAVLGAQICKSCGKRVAETACVYPVTRERRQSVCGRVLCPSCKVPVPGVGCYCRAHALASRVIR